MIQHLFVRNFKAVSHLETSALMQAHPEGIAFSGEKPNVIVGPNGAGKSALLTALALETLTFFTPVSALDDNYTLEYEVKGLWEQVGGWRREYAFLPGLTCVSDKGPALFYRPSHIPGNHDDVTHAMMCGYSREAREYGEMTDNKSSGQQSQALLARVHAALLGDISELRYGNVNWRFGKEPREFEARTHYSDFEYQAEKLKSLYGSVGAHARPVLLLDEPEQSLDAKAEAVLWNNIATADSSRIQVIVATHSLYPLLHPERFHLIEAVPGYANEVRSLL